MLYLSTLEVLVPVLIYTASKQISSNFCKKQLEQFVALCRVATHLLCNKSLEHFANVCRVATILTPASDCFSTTLLGVFVFSWSFSCYWSSASSDISTRVYLPPQHFHHKPKTKQIIKITNQFKMVRDKIYKKITPYHQAMVDAFERGFPWNSL